MQIEVLETYEFSTTLYSVKKDFPKEAYYTSATHLGKTQRVALELGPHFHWIDSVSVKESEILAKMRVACEPIETQRYVLYPGFIDSCFQSLFALDFENLDTLSIPFSIESIIIDTDSSRPRWVYAAHNKSPGSQNSRDDFKLFDESGTQVGDISGFINQSAPRKAIERSLKRQSQSADYFYNLQWEDIPLETIAKDEESLQEIVMYDASMADQNDTSIESATKLLAFLQSQMMKIQLSPVLLLIITRQAYSLNNEPVSLNQAMLNGLIKTAILEHSELSITQVDITQECNISALKNLPSSLIVDENIIALRDEHYYKQRLVTSLQNARANEQIFVPNTPFWQLEQSSRGNLSSLTLQSCNETLPSNNEVQIEIKAVGLNFRDVLVALDLYPGEGGGMGGDCAGVVTKLGENVTDFKIGDKVCGIAFGSFRTFANTNPQLIAKLPDNLSFKEGASLPTIMMTTWYALQHLAHIKAGDKVLIHTGAGGVGLLAIQIAKLAGAIIYTTASAGKQAYLRNLGVEHIYDSRTNAYGSSILRDTQGAGVDIILNTLTQPGFKEASLACLKPGGIFLEISKRAIYSIEEMKQLRNDVIYHIIALDMMFTQAPDKIQQLLQELTPLLKEGSLKAPHITPYSITTLPQAMKFMQQGKNIGKIVINLPPTEIQLHSNGSYLITGGLGGIGLEVAKYLSEHGAGRIILAARREPDEATKKIMAQMSATVTSFQADVGETEQVKQLIDFCDDEKFPLQGIFHAAGLIADALLDKQTNESFEKVFAPKAKGAWNLHHVTQEKNITLAYFVMFSSIASLNGAPSQSNYATANSFLDALALYRHQQGLTALSINWGSWAQVGMA